MLSTFPRECTAFNDRQGNIQLCFERFSRIEHIFLTWVHLIFVRFLTRYVINMSSKFEIESIFQNWEFHVHHRYQNPNTSNTCRTTIQCRARKPDLKKWVMYYLTHRCVHRENKSGYRTDVWLSFSSSEDLSYLVSTHLTSFPIQWLDTPGFKRFPQVVKDDILETEDIVSYKIGHNFNSALVNAMMSVCSSRFGDRCFCFGCFFRFGCYCGLSLACNQKSRMVSATAYYSLLA